MAGPRGKWVDDLSDSDPPSPSSPPAQPFPANRSFSHSVGFPHFQVLNLPYKIRTESELKSQLFGDSLRGAGITFEIRFNREGRAEGRAVATVNSEEAKRALLACNLKEVEGRTIRVEIEGKKGGRVRDLHHTRPQSAKWLLPKKPPVNQNVHYMRQDSPTSVVQPVSQVPQPRPPAQSDPFCGAKPIEKANSEPIKVQTANLQDIDPSIVAISPNKVAAGPVYIVRVGAT